MTTPPGNPAAAARVLWGKGDYGEVARRMQPAADALTAAARIGPGLRVLDVAAGTGNVAIAAARHGGTVVATDLSPELVTRGRERCGSAGIDVEWREADAQALPFEDGTFDAVLSAFGVVYAPDAELATAEMFRVAGRDGVVGVANWATNSFQDEVGRAMVEAAGGVVDDPAVDWGDAGSVRALFLPHASTVETVAGRMSWCFDSVDDWLDRAERVAPPLVALREALDTDRFDEVRWAVRDAAETFAVRAPGGVLLEQRYVIVVARKR